MNSRMVAGAALSLMLTATASAGAEGARFPGLPLEKLEVDASHSHLGFRVGFMDEVEVRGRFPGIQGTILYDEVDPAKTWISMIIDVSTIATGNDSRDGHLATADFFDVENHPMAVFESARIERDGDGYVAHGSIRIRGVEAPLAVPFRVVSTLAEDVWRNRRVVFEGSFELSRAAFGVDKWRGDTNWEPGKRRIASDVVHVDFSIHGIYARVSADRLRDRQKKSLAKVVVETAHTGGAAAAVGKIRALEADTTYASGEGELVRAGYVLLGEGEIDAALAIFTHYTERYPESWNAFDCLGEAYLAGGRREDARDALEKAVALQEVDEHPNARTLLRWLGSTEGS